MLVVSVVPKDMHNVIKWELSIQLSEYHPPGVPWPSGVALERILCGGGVKKLCNPSCSVLVTCTSHLRTRVSLFLLFVWFFREFKNERQNNQIVGAIALGKMYSRTHFILSTPIYLKKISPVVARHPVCVWCVKNDSMCVLMGHLRCS